MISKLKAHSNIVQFFGICLNPLCVVSEFMEKGDLRHFLDDKQNKIEKQQMMKWINQISIGKSLFFQKKFKVPLFFLSFLSFLFKIEFLPKKKNTFLKKKICMK